jgi:hypothetical protein
VGPTRTPARNRRRGLLSWCSPVIAPPGASVIADEPPRGRLNRLAERLLDAVERRQWPGATVTAWRATLSGFTENLQRRKFPRRVEFSGTMSSAGHCDWKSKWCSAHVGRHRLPELRRADHIHHRDCTAWKRARPPGSFLRVLQTLHLVDLACGSAAAAATTAAAEKTEARRNAVVTASSPPGFLAFASREHGAGPRALA